MMNAIGDSLSNFSSSYNEDDREGKDDNHDPELGKLSEDDEPGWVIGNISKTVQHHTQSFRQKQVTLDELTQPGWGDTADHSRERDMKYVMAKLKVPAFVNPHTDSTAATPSRTTVEELI